MARLSRTAHGVARCVGCGMIALLSIGVAGCGSVTAVGSRESRPNRVRLTIVSPPPFLVTDAAHITLRGIVSPPEARVEIQGSNTPAPSGLFVSTLPLQAGTNTLIVDAAVQGIPSARDVVVVVRHLSAELRHTHGGTVPSTPSLPSTSPRTAEVPTPLRRSPLPPKANPALPTRHGHVEALSAPARPRAPAGVTIPQPEPAKSTEPPTPKTEAPVTIPQPTNSE
jgi:hypothetical protein